MEPSPDKHERDQLWEEENSEESESHLGQSFTDGVVRSAETNRTLQDYLQVFLVGFWAIIKGLLGAKP